LDACVLTQLGLHSLSIQVDLQVSVTLHSMLSRPFDP